jgi:hypothetical protein
MANVINSANMNLPVPIVGQDPGHQYATDVNSSLTLIDQHDHSPGYGVRITPAGLNISSDLPLNSNNLTLARSVRFSPQTTPISGALDLGCLYESGVDLYYNDGVGNRVRITQAGGVAGSPGSIANLTSPASASYVAANQTFVWQSGANIGANMDSASYILRNLSIGSFGLTLSPPAAMAVDFTITLPALPAATKLVTMTNMGVMAAAADVDNSTLQFSSNTLSVKPAGITDNELAFGAVTTTKILAGAVVGTNIATGAVSQAKIGPWFAGTSASCGNFSTSSSTYVPVTNLAIPFGFTGRPVMLLLIPDGTGAASAFTFSAAGVIQNPAIYRGGVEIASWGLGGPTGGASLGLGEIIFVDNGGTAGTTATYQIFIKNGGGGTVGILAAKLVAFEL